MFKLAHIRPPRKLLLKLSSLIAGYLLWYTLSSTTFVTYSFTPPVYCYNQSEQHEINFPETLPITIKGARPFFRFIDFTTLAIHIDAHDLHEGKNFITVSHKHLLLPKEISVSHYTPLMVIDRLT